MYSPAFQPEGILLPKRTKLAFKHNGNNLFLKSISIVKVAVLKLLHLYPTQVRWFSLPDAFHKGKSSYPECSKTYKPTSIVDLSPMMSELLCWRHIWMRNPHVSWWHAFSIPSEICLSDIHPRECWRVDRMAVPPQLGCWVPGAVLRQYNQSTVLPHQRTSPVRPLERKMKKYAFCFSSMLLTTTLHNSARKEVKKAACRAAAHQQLPAAP